MPGIGALISGIGGFLANLLKPLIILWAGRRMGKASAEKEQLESYVKIKTAISNIPRPTNFKSAISELRTKWSTGSPDSSMPSTDEDSAGSGKQT